MRGYSPQNTAAGATLMFIVWGTYVRKKKLGRVTDFCRGCGDARPLVVHEHRQCSHVYWIPLGRGTVIGHTGTCEACRREVDVDPDEYHGFSQERAATVEALCDQTNPSLPEQIAARLDALDRLAAGVASREERMRFIGEAVTDVISAYEKRASQAQFDAWACLGLLAMAVTPIVAYVVLDSYRFSDAVLLYAAAAGFLAPTLIVVALVMTDGRRFFRRRIQPELVRLLVPLQPTSEELEQVREALRRQKLKIARRIDPVGLSALVKQQRAAR